MMGRECVRERALALTRPGWQLPLGTAYSTSAPIVARLPVATEREGGCDQWAGNGRPRVGLTELPIPM